MNSKLIHIGKDYAPWLQQQATNANINDVLHFSPANGLPAASYSSFLENFEKQYHLSAMDFRGAWPEIESPRPSFTWQDHADDLISAIEANHKQAVIGVGHSLGATVTLIAAAQRPELFSKIVAIEPATVPSAILARLYKYMPEWLVFRLIPFIRSTHERQRIWASPQAFYENYRTHPTYRRFTDRALRDYAEFGLKQRSEGDYELVHDPHWESFNFRRVEYLWNALEKCQVPTLVLRAEHTYMYTQQQFDLKNANLSSNIQAQTIPGAYHLVSHEQPDLVAEQILNWL